MAKLTTLTQTKIRNIIVDYSTGEFSQAQLAKKYGVSQPVISRLIKTGDAALDEILTKRIEIEREMLRLTPSDRLFVEQAVNRKLQLMDKLVDFKLTAINRARAMVLMVDNGMAFKNIVDGVYRLSLTTGV